MSKKRKDLRGDGASLEFNPFGALRPGAYPEGKAVSEPISPATRVEAGPHKVKFSVGRTRKGGLPLAVEKRAGGKVVTVIRNISGDSDAMLSLLKKKCGAGGVVRDDAIELQGDHLQRLSTMLMEFLK